MRPGSAPAPTARPATLAWLLGLALAAVVVRVVLADEIYLRLVRLPGHDLSQGLGFFASSMDSVYRTGDLAWWSPVSITGYPQYFQAFFGPLAPTYGHITFIAWTHLVALLAAFGIHLPEYVQYLVMNYLVLPFLAFLAFGYFCAQFLRRRVAIAFAMAAYALSGIGLWNGAWFYFQEPATVFFLLGTTLAVLRRPSTANACLWLAAVLVQFASLNYWTVYNILFVAVALGVHAAVYPYRWWRAGRRLRRARRAFPRVSLATAAGTATVIALWTLVMAFAFLDQAGSQNRYVYTVGEAFARIQELRRFTLELFNPLLARPLAQYRVLNEMHNARYIGMMALPLLVLALAGRWDRRMRWLLGCAGLVLALCLGSPYGLLAWVAIPYMDRIHHVFYFYSQYWQILVVLVAAAALDRMIVRARAEPLRWIAPTGLAVAAIVFVAMFVTSERYPLDDPSLQSNLLAALLLAVASLLLGRWASAANPGERRFALVGILLFAFFDLSAYYYAGTRADMSFMERRGIMPVSLDASQKSRFGAPWPETPDLSRGFPAGLPQAMPVRNDFWPTNTFMVPAIMTQAQSRRLDGLTRHDVPFLFYTRATEDGQAHLPDEMLTKLDARLMVAGPAGAAQGEEGPVMKGFAYRWTGWAFNDFGVHVDAPGDGWLMVRQLYEPSWRYTVDGDPVPVYRANYLATALRVSAGPHEIRAEYRPKARAIYWWAAAALEIGVSLLLCVAWLASRGRASFTVPGTPRPGAPARPA